MKWIALFSQTGSEIRKIANELNRWPDEIYTNNFKEENWKHNIDPTKVSIISTEALHHGLRKILPSFITLHGYLRIIPPDVCNYHSIWNGHPAAINMYPELKGKDPQDRAYADNYTFIGSVVHRCVPELDSGEIVSAVCYKNRCNSLEEVYNKCKEASLSAWLHFLRGKV